MLPKFLWGTSFATAALIFFSPTAKADINFRQVSISQSQGTNGKDLPNLEN
jgi:hypothetical protein